MDKFSMGEINARSSEKWWSAHSYKINLLSGKSDDIMEMLLINDAAKRLHPDRERYLFMPYVPYGRQDRVMIPGEALGIKVLADLVNSCGFHEVEIWDPHSDVTTADRKSVV